MFETYGFEYEEVTFCTKCKDIFISSLSVARMTIESLESFINKFPSNFDQHPEAAISSFILMKNINVRIDIIFLSEIIFKFFSGARKR